MATTQQLAELRNVMQDLSGLQKNVQHLAKTVSRGAETAVDQMRGPAEMTRRHARTLIAESSRMARRNPLAIAAAGLAIGLAISLFCARDR